ncbi:MAG: S26 family signal peptidase, partial [Solirubrobacteraceae bacterium]
MRGLVDLVATVAVAVGAALLIQALLVKPYRIPTGSMIPTLEKGQRIPAQLAHQV